MRMGASFPQHISYSRAVSGAFFFSDPSEVMNISHTRALLLLVLTAVLWSSGGVFIKLVDWNALCIAGVRSAIAALVIGIAAPPRTWSPFRLTRYEVGGAIACMLTMVMFVAATKLTTAANAILLQYTAPVHVALFGAWFLGERTTRLDWITILMVFAGMILFFVESLSAANTLGNVLAIASGVSYAWLVLFMRKNVHVRAHEAPTSGSDGIFWGNILTAVVCLPFVVQSFASGFMPSAQSWLGIALLGVFQLGLSYALYSRLIRSVSALEAILIPVVEPLLNPLWVALFAGELPGKWTIIGGIVVIGAVTMRSLAVVYYERQRKTTAESKYSA